MQEVIAFRHFFTLKPGNYKNILGSIIIHLLIKDMFMGLKNGMMRTNKNR